MEFAALVATIIGGVVGVIQLVKWLRKPKLQPSAQRQMKQRPFVDVEVIYKGGQGLALGRGPNARPNPGQDYFIADETLNVYQLQRNITIRLINNSDVAAIYPRLYSHSDSFMLSIGSLSQKDPIKPHESVSVECSYTEIEEKLPRNRSQLDNFPTQEQKAGLKLLVEYQDTSRDKYYTQFSGDANKIEYLEVAPDGFIVSQA